MSVADVGLERLVDSTRPELSPDMRERLSGLILLALDPGETTGYAAFRGTSLLRTGSYTPFCGEISTPSINESISRIEGLIVSARPDALVVENYKIYPWHANDHKWSEVYTPRLIGCIETLAFLRQLPLHKQMAQEAKGFCTDDKLKSWNMYPVGKTHARDAVRHGCYFLLFNPNFWTLFHN